MAVSEAFTAFVRDQLAGLGTVDMRRMFGGVGIFAGDVMFALIADDVLYLKVGEASRAEFEAEGMAPFSYQTAGGRNTIMSYWQCPERLYDEPDELRAWAEQALAVARATVRPKRARKARTGKKAARGEARGRSRIA